MKYLINHSKNWADECDVQFYEILNEEEYQKYMYCKEKLGKFESDFYFGTNEGWDEGDGFDYLDFIPIPITDSESDVIKKYFPYDCESVYDRLMEKIDNYAYDQLQYCISNLSLDGFKSELEKLEYDN